MCILGGEPLCEENLLIISYLFKVLPLKNRKVWIWSGYTYEQLQKRGVIKILKELGVTGIIDGPFIESQKSYEIAMRGSKNQRIYELINGEYIDNTKKYDIIN